eukprot:15658326-Heterocapsa_arctica.AAC.1
MVPRARDRAGSTADGGPRRSSLGSLHQAGRQHWTMVRTTDMETKPGLRATPTTRRASCRELGGAAGEY